MVFSRKVPNCQCCPISGPNYCHEHIFFKFNVTKVPKVVPKTHLFSAIDPKRWKKDQQLIGLIGGTRRTKEANPATYLWVRCAKSRRQQVRQLRRQRRKRPNRCNTLLSSLLLAPVFQGTIYQHFKMILVPLAVRCVVCLGGHLSPPYHHSESHTHHCHRWRNHVHPPCRTSDSQG